MCVCDGGGTSMLCVYVCVWRGHLYCVCVVGWGAYTAGRVGGMERTYGGAMGGGGGGPGHRGNVGGGEGKGG